MEPKDFLQLIRTTLTKLGHDSLEAQALLLAIALQESRLETRQQMKMGPATSFFQFEVGGLRCLVHHPIGGPVIESYCASIDLEPDPVVLHDLISQPDDDELAIVLARANLLCDPEPLPNIGDVQGSWRYYVRIWNPGKPDRNRWTTSYSVALDTIRENPS